MLSKCYLQLLMQRGSGKSSRPSKLHAYAGEEMKKRMFLTF